MSMTSVSRRGWTVRAGLAMAVCLLLAPAAQARTGIAGSVVATLAPTLRRTHELVGPAPAGDPVTALVALKPRDPGGLDALVARVTDPADPSYGHYLTPAQYRARFAPTKADAAAVTGWLRAGGLHVGALPANRLFVPVSGTVEQAQRAFGLTIGRLRALGAIVQAPLTAARVPARLAGIVAGVRGLDGGDVAHANSILPPPAFQTGNDCSKYFGELPATGTPGAFGEPGPFPLAPCGYTPDQLHSAYGLDAVYKAGVDGSGVTVAIIDPFDSPRAAQDTATYSAKHGLAPASLTRVADPYATLVPNLPTDSATLLKVPGVGRLTGLVDPDGATEEETLDIEAIHAIAPGAHIVYEATDSLLNISLLLAQNDVVDHARAQIVSNSYGSASDTSDTTSDAIFKQAAAEGIGFYFSSGDQGDETKDPDGPGDRETDDFANNPYVTAVGGTAMGIGADGKAAWQTYWGNYTSTLSGGAWNPNPPGNFYAGGGGGTSQAYAEPDYQKGIVPDDLASYWKDKPPESGAGADTALLLTKTITSQVPGRVEPDISMLGDPNTGMIVGDTQDFTAIHNLLGQQLPGDDVRYAEFRIGGTSLACPLLAALMALADQAAGHAHGFANPALYAAYKADATIATDLTASPVKRAVVRRDFANKTDTTAGISTLLRDFDDPITLHDRPGFDDATGMGTPNGLHFLRALAPGSKLLPDEPADPSAPRALLPARASCKRDAPLVIHLRAAAGQRIVKATGYVDGKRVRVLRGRKLRSITLHRPSRRKFTVKVVMTTGARLKGATKKTYRACGGA